LCGNLGNFLDRKRPRSGLPETTDEPADCRRGFGCPQFGAAVWQEINHDLLTRFDAQVAKDVLAKGDLPLCGNR